MQAVRLFAAGVIALATAMMPVAATARAQDFPNKTVRIIVSFSAGGTTDVIARKIAERLTHHWGQPVVVENKPGAGGTLGTDYTANQPADGYTILMSSSGPMVISPSLPKKLATDPLTATVPVILVADVANVLVTAPELNIKSMQELVQKGKANPGELNYASTGAEAVGGTAQYFADLVRRDYEGWKPVIRRTGAGAN
jgi:tripartite-type tricarboxylate transporter receptor subunit TctC